MCLGTCCSLNGIPFSTLRTVTEAPNPTQLDSVKYFLLMIQVVRTLWGFKTSQLECLSSYAFPRDYEVLKVRRILLIWQTAWNTIDEERAAKNHQGHFRYMHNVLLVSFNEQKKHHLNPNYRNVTYKDREDKDGGRSTSPQTTVQCQDDREPEESVMRFLLMYILCTLF